MKYIKKYIWVVFLFILVLLSVLPHYNVVPSFKMEGTVVVIDPGHGGDDVGCSYKNKIHEKDITMAVANKVAQILEQQGAKVILTRNNNQQKKSIINFKNKNKNITLKERVDLTTKNNADIFISLHVNSASMKSKAGAVVYYKNNNAGKQLAENVQKELRYIPDMNKRTCQKGNYYLINKLNIPAAVIELGYLTSNKDRQNLINPAYQKEMAEAINRGIIKYLENPRSKTTNNNIKAKAAIVIDDFGQSNTKGVAELLSIDKPLTFAVMPHLENTEKQALEAAKKGYEIIVHLPLQPKQGKASWLGPGAITANMSIDEIRRVVSDDFEQVPFAIGFNNHTGSLITSKEELMRPILEEAKNKEFFVLDSKTSEQSKIIPLAQEMKIPYAKRDVFLDDSKNTAQIKKKLSLLAEKALKNGSAIAIGHVGLGGDKTAKAIKEMMPKMEAMGIEFVYLSDLVKLNH